MVCMHAVHGMQLCMHYMHSVCVHACGERWRGAPAAPWRGRWQLCACCRRTRERSGGDATHAQRRRRRGRAPMHVEGWWSARGRAYASRRGACAGRAHLKPAGCCQRVREHPRPEVERVAGAPRRPVRAVSLAGTLASTRSRRTASARRQPRAGRRLLGPRRRSWQPRPAARPRAQKVETAPG